MAFCPKTFPRFPLVVTFLLFSPSFFFPGPNRPGPFGVCLSSCLLEFVPPDHLSSEPRAPSFFLSLPSEFRFYRRLCSLFGGVGFFFFFGFGVFSFFPFARMNRSLLAPNAGIGDARNASTLLFCLGGCLCASPPSPDPP